MKAEDVNKELDAIRENLKAIESHLAWLITADMRFRPGQRIEWSRHGREVGFPRRKIAQKGTVRAVEKFSIDVKLDGLKTVTSFHHSFFNPVSGPKLF